MGTLHNKFDSLQGMQVERFVDSEEAARFIGLNPKTLQRLARQAVIPAHALGDGVRKRWRFLLSELDEWMRSRVNSPRRPCHDEERKDF